MARYYFHFRNGRDYVEDMEGLDLLDAEAAHEQGVEALREMLASDVRQGLLDKRCSIEIDDENHRKLESIACGNVLQIIGEEPHEIRHSG